MSDRPDEGGELEPVDDVLDDDGVAGDDEPELLQPQVVGAERPRTDRLAIGSLAAGIGAFVFVGSIFMFVLIPASIGLGLKALGRIKASGNTIPGRRFAQAGMAIAAAAVVLFAVLYITFAWEKEGGASDPTPKEEQGTD